MLGTNALGLQTTAGIDLTGDILSGRNTLPHGDHGDVLTRQDVLTPVAHSGLSVPPSSTPDHLLLSMPSRGRAGGGGGGGHGALLFWGVHTMRVSDSVRGLSKFREFSGRFRGVSSSAALSPQTPIFSFGHDYLLPLFHNYSSEPPDGTSRDYTSQRYVRGLLFLQSLTALRVADFSLLRASLADLTSSLYPSSPPFRCPRNATPPEHPGKLRPRTLRPRNTTTPEPIFDHIGTPLLLLVQCSYWALLRS